MREFTKDERRAIAGVIIACIAGLMFGYFVLGRLLLGN